MFLALLSGIVYFSFKDRDCNSELIKEIILTRTKLNEVSEEIWDLKRRIRTLEREFTTNEETCLNFCLS
jgi:hypothetical protein